MVFKQGGDPYKGQPSSPELDRQHEMCFCEENIQHLFFDCYYAKFLWRTLHITFNIQSPMSINDMFTNWLLALGRKHRGDKY
jgi:hypothetical protein